MKNQKRHVLIENAHLLQCPICNSPFSITDPQLKCARNHAYDIAGSGYINFQTKAVNSPYNKHLFEARSRVTEKGFFNALENKLTELILEEHYNKKNITLLDAGCGEGTLYAGIINNLKRHKDITVTSVGIDISKCGIQMASRKYPEVLWLAANLANLPVKSGSADVILNTLAPANYSQFSRVLKAEGTLLKTIPNKNYLVEIRNAFSKAGYDRGKTVKLFRDNNFFNKEANVQDKKFLRDYDKRDILAMTPLTWNIDYMTEDFDLTDEINIDLTILAGRKHA